MSEKKWYLNKKVTLILILAAVLLLCSCSSNTPEKDAVTEEAEDTVVSSETETFDLEKGTVMLNSGYTMPIIGLGTWTLSNDEAVYKAMEQAVRDGKVRSIGISNYYTKGQVDEVLSYAEITPAVIQNENHLYYQNKALQEYVKQYGFELTDEDMERIRDLDRQERYENW